MACVVATAEAEIKDSMLQGKDDSQPGNGANQQGTTAPEATISQPTTQQAKVSEDDFEDVTVEGLVLHSA